MHKRATISRKKRALQKKLNSEIIFLVEEDIDGGFVARALGAPIFTEADDEVSLHSQIRDAVRCHYNPRETPKMIRLHFVREEVLPV